MVGVGRGMVNNRGMSLSTSLGGKGKSDLLTARISDDNLLLLHSVGGISKLGNIKTLGLNLVLTFNLSDLDSFGDTDFFWGRVGKAAGNLKRSSYKGNLVGLGLVFLTTNLMFSLSISIRLLSIPRSSTTGNLHSLRLLLISNLGGGAGSNNILSLIDVSADLSLNNSGGLLTDGKDPVKAVVVVNNLLDCKGDWGHLLSKSRDTDLSIDRSVGVSTCVGRSISRSRGIAIARVGCAYTSNKTSNKYKHDVDCLKILQCRSISRSRSR